MDTPETDKAEFPVMTFPSRDHPLVVRSILSRKLERQRNAAFAILKDIRANYGEQVVEDGCGGPVCEYLRLIDKLLNQTE